MNNEKINAFFNDIVLDKFIINFIPGLILLHVVSSFIGFSAGGTGLAALLIIASVSWVLGILLEMVFFKKVYHARREGKKHSISENINLLFGKLGISILIACVSWINVYEIKLYFDHYRGRGDGAEIFFIIAKFLIVVLIGVFLYLHYLKSRIKDE